MKTTFCYDHYFLYEEMTACLQKLQTVKPEWMQLETLGVTQQGRQLWAVTITDPASGAAQDKPALYVDGNQHAGEVASSMVAMHLIDVLVTGADEIAIHDLLQKYTFYVIPRVALDGAELYMTTPDEVRSIPQALDNADSLSGLHLADVDGDGAIRYMRVKNANGCWKVSPDDDRMMVRRKPWETQGVFYNVYREGVIEGWNGVDIQMADARWPQDFNRNFPIGWEHDKWTTTGRYPLCHMETKALADFVLNHPNIASVLTFHTAGGYFIYPPQFPTDKATYEADRRLYEARGEWGHELTGYPVLNLFRQFWPKDSKGGYGAFDDWCHEALGIPAMTIECWSLNQISGVPNAYPMSAFGILEEDAACERDTIQILRWMDEHLGKDTFKPWTKAQHPQLGEVEIGGVNHKFTVQNCPPAWLHQEVEKLTAFILGDVRCLPQLSVDSIMCEKVAEHLCRVTAVVGNRGYLPTHLTYRALKLHREHPVTVTLSGYRALVEGSRDQRIAQLGGFGSIQTGHIGYIGGINTLRHEPVQEKLSWLVSVEEGDELCVECRCPTAVPAVRTWRVTNIKEKE